MALIRPTVTPFPIFAPSSTDTSTTTEVRFSRWNNANAEKFEQPKRTLKEIEDDLRRHRRYQSALSIANLPTNPPSNSGFRSIGTPSSPSSPSIPGKRSKYSKTPKPNSNPSFSMASTHPAFRKLKTKPIPTREVDKGEGEAPIDVRVVEGGVSYVVPGAPFEYMYSYTETPKVKPLALREPPITPFGPQTMPRPWTGRKPFPPSKKNLPEFDSFSAPSGKKGMKPVQRPGPYLPGSGPKHVWSREEILGEPLTKEEVDELIEGCRKSTRQLNMGRDGLTHNMLDNIHSLWKRRRVCKIKCKGVCTVDIQNVCQQLEEKTGGKIIYQRGGVVFLFRGRNYNYRTRPQFPLMLWKPVTPVYPRLIKRVPDGLTLEEVTEMRRKSRELTPICKLAKNGVYVSLVADVREAFEACELVRIDCQGLNPSDYRKIGGKLKDLVPCVLISFENEHILIWRGREWKSSFLDENENGNEISALSDTSDVSTSGDEEASSSSYPEISSPGMSVESLDASITVMVGAEVGYPPLDNMEASLSHSEEVLEQEAGVEKSDSSLGIACAENIGITGNQSLSCEEDEESVPVHNKEDIVNTVPPAQDDTNRLAHNVITSEDETSFIPAVSGFTMEGTQSTNNEQEVSNIDVNTIDPSNTEQKSCPADSESPYMQDVLLLLRQAVESGSAVVLDDTFVDADLIYQRSVSLAKVAPPGPVFRLRPRKISVNKSENQETAAEEVKEAVLVVEKKVKERTRSKSRGVTRFKGVDGGVLPQGSLGVDELAKLLA